MIIAAVNKYEVIAKMSRLFQSLILVVCFQLFEYHNFICTCICTEYMLGQTRGRADYNAVSPVMMAQLIWQTTQPQVVIMMYSTLVNSLVQI